LASVAVPLLHLFYEDIKNPRLDIEKLRFSEKIAGRKNFPNQWGIIITNLTVLKGLRMMSDLLIGPLVRGKREPGKLPHIS
jgi:hypothetical protein